jgi:hypothetical protein
MVAACAILIYTICTTNCKSWLRPSDIGRVCPQVGRSQDSAEGATTPETLRQKDRYRVYTLKSCRTSSPDAPKEQALRCHKRSHVKSLRSRTEGVFVSYFTHGFHFGVWSLRTMKSISVIDDNVVTCSRRIARCGPDNPSPSIASIECSAMMQHFRQTSETRS